MARKVVSRRALREESDAAEAAEKAAPTKKKAAKKKATKKKAAKKTTEKKAVKKKAATRSRTAKVVRLRALWGVFNQSMRRVAIFEYAEQRKAEKMAAQLTEKAKAPHFVQCVKEAIEE